MSTAQSQPKGQLRGGLWIKKESSVYSPEQVAQWLKKIGYPGDPESFEPSLDNLCLLARLNLTTFPFENTPMHYTKGNSMDITYEGLFKRLVAPSESGDAGSYCFGLNGIFFQMLRGLGFRVFSGSGRINEQPPGSPEIFHAFVHMILFVQPIEGSNETYFVDVGAGPVRPMLLEDGECVPGSSPSESHILMRTGRTDSSLESSPSFQGPEKFEWRLKSVHTKDSTGSPTTRVLYSFIEDEFFDADYKSFNYSVLGLRAGLFWENVVCTKFFWMSDEEVRHVDGKVNVAALMPLTRYMGRLAMAGDAVRRHLGTETTVLRVMKTEEERMEALKEFFNIKIPVESLKYIRGRGAELGKE
ncbi:hypothetical protein FB45DRAFT_922607 [Roridomyces roridus]|uniref:Arylamine N-acetyltransferase n=1 Tax=Roridomyces roridus TaxID=1738132 RepID=A0AAD7BNG7_9AGAR|nr:hypothetical protein FB45DRAFT_922607 [Roridomyces roridus]